MVTQTKRACLEIVPTSSNVIRFFFFFFFPFRRSSIADLGKSFSNHAASQTGNFGSFFLRPFSLSSNSTIKSFLNFSTPTFKATIERLSKMPFHGKAIQKSSISLFHLIRSSPLFAKQQIQRRHHRPLTLPFASRSFYFLLLSANFHFGYDGGWRYIEK